MHLLLAAIYIVLTWDGDDTEEHSFDALWQQEALVLGVDSVIH